MFIELFYYISIKFNFFYLIIILYFNLIKFIFFINYDVLGEIF